MVEAQKSKLTYKKYSEKEYLKVKAKRREIYKETKKISEDNFYINNNNEKIDLQIEKDVNEKNILSKELIEKKVDVSQKISQEDIIQIQDDSYTLIGKFTKLYIINGDTLEVAMKFFQKGFKVAALNMASDKNPGGGVEGGAGAQEESLFRRSNYFQYLVPNKQNYYPIPISSGILSKRVKVFRAPESKDYQLLDQPFEIDFIAVAALRSPSLKKTKKGLQYSPEDQLSMEKKITTILSLGAASQAQCLILGAFGCGAFHNPPELVSEIFKQIIYKKFIDVFQCIIFAIIEDHNSNGNIYPFTQCFCYYFIYLLIIFKETKEINISDLIL